MNKFILALSCAAILSFTTSDKLTGRWETRPSQKGNVTGVIFHEDNTFEGYVNNKPFVNGTYSLKGDKFSFTDNGCDGLPGEYRLVFFSGQDSLKLELISDACVERSEGMQRLVLGRVPDNSMR